MKKSLRILQILEYHDVPVLFIAADSANVKCLCMLVELNAGNLHYLSTQISEHRLAAFINGRIDLRSIFMKPETAEFYSIRDLSTENIRAELFDNKALKEEFLPGPGYYYTKTDDSILQKSKDSADTDTSAPVAPFSDSANTENVVREPGMRYVVLSADAEPVHDPLFALVKSLSQVEKTQFIQYATRRAKNKYQVLFDYVDKVHSAAEYDEQKIKHDLAGTIPHKHFAGTKKYLYDHILKSLWMHRRWERPSDKVRSLIEDARVLRDKGFYTQCARRLQQAKKKAIKLDLFPEWLSICDFQRLLLGGLNAEHIVQQTDSLRRETNTVIEFMNNLNYYRNLYDQVYAIIRGKFTNVSDEDRSRIDELLNDEIMTDEKNAHSFHAKKYFYKIKAQAALIYGHADAACDHYHNLVKLWESNNEQSKDDLRGYIMALTDYAGFCLQVGRYQDFRAAMKKFNSIEPETPGDKAERFQNEFHLELLGALNIPDFDYGTTLVPQLRVGLKQHEIRMNPARILALLYNCTMLYFLSGQFTEALDWNNRIIARRKTEVRRDIIIFAHLLAPILHYELENHDYIENLFRNNMYYLKKEDELGDFERQLLRLLRRLPGSTDEKRSRNFKRMQAEIDELRVVRGTKDLGLHELWCWLESKIKGTSISNVYHSLKNADGKDTRQS